MTRVKFVVDIDLLACGGAGCLIRPGLDSVDVQLAWHLDMPIRLVWNVVSPKGSRGACIEHLMGCLLTTGDGG